MSMQVMSVKNQLKQKYNFYTPEVCDELIKIVYHFSNMENQDLLIEEINKKRIQVFESPYQTIQYLNTTDDMTLLVDDNDNFKKKEEYFNDQLHINQITAAFKIFVNFMNEKRYNVLCAQFQSGKTGASICLLFFFHSFRMMLCMKDIMIEGAIIFSGLSFTSLRDQWIEKLNKYKGIPKKFTNKQNVKWGEDLKKCYEKYNNHIFIHDESYRVSAKNMRVHDFYSLQKLKPSYGIDKENYINRNIYTLSVCATPFAELVRNRQDNQQKEIIVMEPGKNYVGLKTIKLHNKLKSAYKITIENKEKLASDIQEAFDFYDTFRSNLAKSDYSNCIIRLPDGKTKLNRDRIEIIEDIAEENGWDIKFIKQSGKEVQDNEITNFNIYFDNVPSNDTIIIIHQKLGLGDNLEKKYIAMGFEYTNYKNGQLTTKQDNMLQGLLGRFCSYYDIRHIPFIYCDINTVDEYIDFVDSQFTNFQNIPKNSQHIKINKPKMRRSDPHYSLIIPIRNKRHPFIEDRRYKKYLLDTITRSLQVKIDDRISIKKEIIDYLQYIKNGRFKFYNDNLNKNSIVDNIIEKLEDEDDKSSFRNFDSNNKQNSYRQREDLMKLFQLAKNPKSQSIEEYAMNSVYFDNQDKIQICYSKSENVLFLYAYIFDEENHNQIHNIGKKGITGLIGTDVFQGDLKNFSNGNVCKDDDIDLEKLKDDYLYTLNIIKRKLKSKTHTGYDIENKIGGFFYINENLVNQYKKNMQKDLRKIYNSKLKVTVSLKRASKKQRKEGYKVCNFIKVRL